MTLPDFEKRMRELIDGGHAALVVDFERPDEGDAFTLDISDWGEPFDVLSLPEPDTTRDVMHRPLGGLGVDFIRTFSKSATYQRDDDRNVLRMLFRP